MANVPISKLTLLACCFLTVSLDVSTSLGADANVIRAGKAATALVDLGDEGSGSAFCIRADGMFITNQHVVGTRSVGEEVTLILDPATQGQKSVEARIMKMDPLNDLAILKAVGVKDLPVVALGQDESLFETQEVIVFGYPFGRLLSPEKEDAPSITVNTGKVSALRRRGRDLAMIQIDAKVNPGNSGGPVLDERGNVIGVVVSTILGSGVSFAIPVSQVTEFLDKPGIHLSTLSIPYGERFQPHEVEIGVFEYREQSRPLMIKVTTTSPSGSPRSVMAKDRGAGYIATINPFIEPDKKPLFEVYALLDDEVFVCESEDIEIRVGDQSFRLEEIVQIDKRPELSIVTTISRRKFAGRVEGLPRLKDRESGDEVSLGDAERIEIYSSDRIESHAQVEVTASRAGKTLARIEHNLTLNSAPHVANPNAESEIDGGLPWKSTHITPERQRVKARRSSDGPDLRWTPLASNRPSQCLKLGPFPARFDGERVLDFIAKADLEAELLGNRLTPTMIDEERFLGPLTPKSAMYYVFYLRAPQPQNAKVTFETFTNWDHSTLDVFVDFEEFDFEQNNLLLREGEHVVVVKQNHDHSDRPDRSWIRFTIEGDGLELGQYPSLGGTQQDFHSEFLKNNLGEITWSDLPADRLLADAFVLGVLPEDHNPEDVLEYLAKFEVDDDWEGYSLTPRKPRTDEGGKFSGPLAPATSQYDMFLVRANGEQQISWSALTELKGGRNSIETFLDFEPVEDEGETTLESGVHVFLVRQNRLGGDGFDSSWVSLSLFGSGLEVGSMPGTQPPPNGLFTEYEKSGGLKLDWKPLGTSPPDKCLKLGPFPEGFDQQDVFEFIARGDLNAELLDSRLTMAELSNEQFQGPPTPDTSMYYVFFVRTEEEKHVDVHFDTYWDYNHSWLETFVDFRPIDPHSRQVALRAGEHIVIVCQHHHYSEVSKFSFVQFGIDGLGIEIGEPASTELAKLNADSQKPAQIPNQVQRAEALKGDLTGVVWNDLPADRLVPDAFVIGAFPEKHSESDVFDYLRQFEVDDDWQGYSLTPRKPREGGYGQFSGPLTPHTCQYYMFLVRTDEEADVSWDARTFSYWKESTAELFLDFVPVDLRSETTLSPGVHVFVLKQNHHESARYNRSWVSLSLFGSGLQVGSMPGEQPPPSPEFIRYKNANRFRLQWHPLEEEGPQQCLELGPFPERHDHQQVFDLLTRGTPNAKLMGQPLTSAESVEGKFPGPTKQETVMYYVFFVRTPEKQTAKVHFETYWNYQHSWLESFVDFRTFDSSSKLMPLDAGEHIIVICQHHNHSDRPEFSWIEFGIEGEEIDVGLPRSIK